MEIQTNKINTINPKVKYMFLNWDGFINQLMQIYSDLKATTTAEQKLLKLIQKGLATNYTIIF